MLRDGSALGYEAGFAMTEIRRRVTAGLRSLTHAATRSPTRGDCLPSSQAGMRPEPPRPHAVPSE